MRTRWFVLLVMLILSPIAAQDHPSGVIIEGSSSQIETLNPVFCNNSTCRHLGALLYPMLIGVDPATGLFTPGAGAADNWTISEDGTVYTVTLKDGLTWSDGTPVTAYDVFLSYLAASKNEESPYYAGLKTNVLAAAPFDAQTIAFQMVDTSCDALRYINLPVIPAHQYAGTTFQDRVIEVFDGAASVTSGFEAWQAEYPRASYGGTATSAESRAPTVSIGLFRFDPGYVDMVSSFRLYRTDDSIRTDAYVLAYTEDENDTVDHFINGETNLIINPPVNRWQDIRAVPNVQVFQFPGKAFDYITLNVANPERPRAFDDERGQEHHPVFADPQVWKAIRLAIDVEALIEAGMQGNGQPIALNQAPGGWAYDTALTPPAYNPREAERLLESAGWKDTNGDGTRECIECPYGRDGGTLSFTLKVNHAIPRLNITAELLRQQLESVGFSVNVDGGGSDVTHQTFDAYLSTFDGGYPYEPDMSAWFTQAQDVPETGLNITSYVNPELEAKLIEAVSVCDITQRGELYNDPALQQMLMNDVPYIWLYAPDEFYAASAGVHNFAPLPGNPLANMAEWQIIR